MGKPEKLLSSLSDDHDNVAWWEPREKNDKQLQNREHPLLA